ncbi:hypothetical protein B0H17DRAFT_1152073 [Mycena rosella]|uniref:Uncharacterized protein n=1 Tax=Mycena rosella TaxID=1033263 RepID=A0AAD7BGE9_MYCRO|nr:hypothetical protein B0H17DRAFT_1152073 [Mycena rosella]
MCEQSSQELAEPSCRPVMWNRLDTCVARRGEAPRHTYARKAAEIQMFSPPLSLSPPPSLLLHCNERVKMAINSVEGSKHTATDLELLDSLLVRQLMDFRNHMYNPGRLHRTHLRRQTPMRPSMPGPPLKWRVDETVAEEIQMSLRTGILGNPNNEMAHRVVQNRQHHTASARKFRESRQLTDVSKELQMRLSAEVEKHREALKAQLKAAKEGSSKILTASSSGRVKTAPARSVPVYVPSTTSSENTMLFPTTHFSEPMSAFIPPQPAPNFSEFFMPSYDPLPFGTLTAPLAPEFPLTTSNTLPMEFSGIDFSTFDIDMFFGFNPTFNTSIPSAPPAEYPQSDYMNSFAPFFPTDLGIHHSL